MLRVYIAWFDENPSFRRLRRRLREYRAGQDIGQLSNTFSVARAAQRTFPATLTDRQFVVALFEQTLGRRPERSERAVWVQRLQDGQTRPGLVARVSKSSAFKSRNAASVATTAAYAGLLRRMPTGTELSAGGDAGDVLASGEYEDRASALCNASYPDFCIPSEPPDLDCGDSSLLGRVDFRVAGEDPHELDQDGNGVGCESGTTTPGPGGGPSPEGGIINIYNDPWDKLVIRDVLPFSTARTDPTPAKRVRVRNVGTARLDVTEVAIEGSSAFRLVAGQARAFSLAPQQETTISVEFRPGPVLRGKGTQHLATMAVLSSDRGQPRDEVFLRGWQARDYENNVEPSRAEIVSTIGYTTNVGQGLPRDDVNAGEEVRSAYWRRAGAGAVELYPLARYAARVSGDTGRTFWFPQGNSGDRRTLHIFPGCRCVDPTLGTGGQNQKLVPEYTAVGGGVGQTRFDPGTGAFGLAVNSSGELTHSDDSLNTDGGHTYRFWPARDRTGELLPNTWIVGQDLGASPENMGTKNYDYQDFMWVLSNATPAQPAGA
ncbi:MAG: DUF4214 domain-containing protein [Acidimicrobiia bacterium]|nr:DUF4214 domain-containing protein [Acidimicrobiia bacterium]